MPRRYSMEIRQEETAARRRRLIDAAIEVLAETGADRLSMEAVAGRGGATTRTLYNHFSSRDELIAQALGRLLQEFRDALDTQPPGQGDPAERLRSFVRLLYDTYDRQGRSLTTLLDHSADPQIGTQITRRANPTAVHAERARPTSRRRWPEDVERRLRESTILRSTQTAAHISQICSRGLEAGPPLLGQAGPASACD